MSAPAGGRGPASELAGLLEELERLAPFTPPDVAARSSPERSGWSVGQHLEHLLRAAELNLRAIEAIEGGRDDGPEPPQHPAAEEILASGSIPRGADAPAPVVPSESPDPSTLEPLRERQVRRWTDLTSRLDSLAGRAGRVPHPLLGAFRALDWLRFARVHTAHHRRLIEEILGP